MVHFHIKADHLAAGDLTYRCLGGQQYEFTFTMYRDCAGSKGNAKDIQLNSAGCGSATCSLTEISRTDVATPCPTAKTNCYGGTVPGLQAVVFRGTVTLPGTCTDWTIKWHDSNRNNAITTLQGAGGNIGLTVMDSMFNLSCNNSPVFINKPIMYACVGQKFCFSAGATDVDGDSLVYVLSSPLSIGTGTTNNGAVIYGPGYSYTNFVSSSTPITIDHNTGEVCFTPTKIEVTILAVRILEYRKGIKIGSTERDMELWVSSCNNNLPTGGGINGTKDYSITACAGNQLCFTFNTDDADAADQVTAMSNNLIPGATLTFAGAPHPTGTFCWTPKAQDVRGTPYLLTLILNDDHCPLEGTQNVSYSIYVKNCVMEAKITGQKICAGSCFKLAAKVIGGTPPYTYSWSPSPLTSNSDTANVCPVTNTIYTVTITDSKGVKASDTAMVSLYPSINTIASTVPAKCGAVDGSATVTVSGGTPPFTYLWNTVPSQHTATATGLASGHYTVVITDALGCSVTDSITVTASPSILIGISLTNSKCGASDGTATITASGGAGTPYTYSWSPSGGNAATANGLAAGTYTVSVSDKNGCKKDTTITILDSGSPVLRTSKTDILCNGDSTGTITTNVNGGVSPYTYSWTPLNSGASNLSGLKSGAYTVTVTGANGCKASSNITITEPPAIALSISKVDANCKVSNGSITVNATGGVAPYSYTWSGGGSTNTKNNIPSGSYTVTVTDQNACSKTAVIHIDDIGAPVVAVSTVNSKCNGQSNGSAIASVTGGKSPYTYSWNTSPVQLTPVINNLKAGTYELTVTDSNSCKASVSITVTEPLPIKLIASSINENCGKSNGSITVTASGGMGPYSYLWNNGQVASTATGLAAGTYTITVTDSNACTKSMTGIVRNTPGPIANFNAKNGCIHSQMVFNNTSTGGNSWKWDFGDNTFSTIQNPFHSYTDSGSKAVKLFIVDSSGCSDSITKNINVYPLPQVSFDGKAEGCSPLNVSFTNTSDTGTYRWYFGDYSTSDQTAPVHTYINNSSNIMEYAVKLIVTSTQGCVDSLKKSLPIKVYPMPVAQFTISPKVTEVLDPKVNFFDESTGNSTFLWNFGDITKDSIHKNPMHVFPDTGTYNVCLSIKNAYGCADDICHPVIVKPIWSLYIPNAFTPNGDGINENFGGYGNGISDYELIIFDRWGNLIFKSNDLNIGWDGRTKLNGSISEEDVYVYKIGIRDVLGKRHEYIGRVTLVK